MVSISLQDGAKIFLSFLGLFLSENSEEADRKYSLEEGERHRDP